MKVFPQPAAPKKGRHVLTPEERSRGGKKCAELYDMSIRGQAGFWATMERHPQFAMKYLAGVMAAKYPNGPKWKRQAQ